MCRIRFLVGVIALLPLYPTVILSKVLPWSLNEPRQGNEHYEKYSPAPSEGRMTNAKRLTAGLPPLPPVKKHQREGSLAPRQSGSPTLTGVLALAWESSGVGGTITLSAATLSPYGPSDISASGILAGGRADAMFANLQSDNNGYFTFDKFQPAIDPSSDVPTPTSSGGSDYYETKIWYYNPIDSTLRIRWNNGGGDIVDVNLFVSLAEGQTRLGPYGTAHSDSSGLPVLPGRIYVPVTVTFTQT
ncbi:hypothetical protein FRB99_008549 [Tulasnella sp. 403]|nr:hypothetical protein FRB99_008549 [Tulasnella sp. 403]